MARKRFPALSALVVAVAALALAATPQTAAQQRRVIGIAAAVRYEVLLKPAGAPRSHVAVVREKVALQDEVRTGPRSQLQLLLLDKSIFSVGANARLTIDRFVYDPSRGPSSVGATVARGAFRFMSGKAGSSGSQIRTPIATIGIRGTILEGVVGSDAVRIADGEPAVGPGVGGDVATASLIILRGPGVAAQAGARRGSITVGSGRHAVPLDRPLQAVFVPAAGMAPIGPFVISREGLAKVQALLYPLLAERLGWASPTPVTELPLPPQQQPRRLPPRGFPGPGPAQPGGPALPGGPLNLPQLPQPQQPQRPPPQPDPQRPPPTTQQPAPGPTAPPPTTAPPPQQQPPPGQTAPPPRDPPPTKG